MHNPNAENHNLEVGTQHYDNSTGAPTKCTYRDVQFHARKLQELKTRSGTETTEKKLFELPKGEIPEGSGPDEKYIVHTCGYSRWQGTSTRKRIHGPVSAEDLTDKWPELAKEADISVPVSLDAVI